MGDTLLPDTWNTVATSPCLGNPTDPPTNGVGPGTGGGGVCASMDEPVTEPGVGYRIRILEPVEVSSPMEVHQYPDRESAIITVNQIATKLTMRGFTSYRINIIDPNDRTVWTMTNRRKDGTRHGG